MKFTVPVGVPSAFAVTVAVNVTGWLNCDGFWEEVTAVVVGIDGRGMVFERLPA